MESIRFWSNNIYRRKLYCFIDLGDGGYIWCAQMDSKIRCIWCIETMHILTNLFAFPLILRMQRIFIIGNIFLVEYLNTFAPAAIRLTRSHSLQARILCSPILGFVPYVRSLLYASVSWSKAQQSLRYHCRLASATTSNTRLRTEKQKSLTSHSIKFPYALFVPYSSSNSTSSK